MYIPELIPILGYFIGAIPTGYLFARAHGILDIRKLGSGNIGATNVSRFLGKKSFFFVLILDACKAALFMYLLMYFNIGPIGCYVGSVSLLIGNGYSIFLGFDGGKGVATSLGVLSVISPPLVGIALCCWIVSLFLTQTVAIASLLTAIVVPICATCFNLCVGYSFLVAIISMWIVWRHKGNIKKMLYS